MRVCFSLRSYYGQYSCAFTVIFQKTAERVKNKWAFNSFFLLYLYFCIRKQCFVRYVL